MQPAMRAMPCRSSAAGSLPRSALHLYTRPSFVRLAATWAVGVPAAVLVRALVLGRTLGGKEAAFLIVSLVTIGVLVSAFRLMLTLLSPRVRPARS